MWALKSVSREADKCVLWQQDDNYTEETCCCLVAKLRRCDCINKGLECNNHCLQGADNDFSCYINSARTAMTEVHFQVNVSQLLHGSRFEYACLLCRAPVRTMNHSPPLPTKSSLREQALPSSIFLFSSLFTLSTLDNALCAVISSCLSYLYTVHLPHHLLALSPSLSLSHVSWRPSQPSLSELTIHVA